MQTASAPPPASSILCCPATSRAALANLEACWFAHGKGKLRSPREHGLADRANLGQSLCCGEGGPALVEAVKQASSHIFILQRDVVPILRRVLCRHQRHPMAFQCRIQAVSTAISFHKDTDTITEYANAKLAGQVKEDVKSSPTTKQKRRCYYLNRPKV